MARPAYLRKLIASAVAREKALDRYTAHVVTLIQNPGEPVPIFEFETDWTKSGEKIRAEQVETVRAGGNYLTRRNFSFAFNGTIARRTARLTSKVGAEKLTNVSLADGLRSAFGFPNKLVLHVAFDDGVSLVSLLKLQPMGEENDSIRWDIAASISSNPEQIGGHPAKLVEFHGTTPMCCEFAQIWRVWFSTTADHMPLRIDSLECAYGARKAPGAHSVRRANRLQRLLDSV
jgi:hypothetical protein